MLQEEQLAEVGTIRSAGIGAIGSRTPPDAQSRAALVLAAPRESRTTGSRWVRPIIAWGLRRARRFERSKQVPQALRIALRLANLVPAVPVVQFYVARVAMALGDADTARRALHAAIQSDELSRVKSYSHVARKFLELNDLVAAEGCLEKARAAFPASSRVWILLGELHRVRGNVGDAERFFDEALSHASSGRDRFGALNGLAGCFADTGRKDDAKNVYTRMIELGPDTPWACHRLVHSQGDIGVSDVIVRTMIEMLESARLGSEGRMNLHYALGMVFDGARQYGDAFAHFMLANAIRARRIGRYDEESLRRNVDARIQTFSQERIADLAKYGDQSEFLICIVGMPRSGTTLLEQILSSHPGVVGLGERLDFWNLANGLRWRLRSRHLYPLCCRTMSPQQVRDIAASVREQLCRSLGSFSKVVTKLPGDCWEVGLIKVLFPRAKIVHSRRHPIDTCLSCFMQNFQNIAFATDLYSLTAAYRLNQRIMNHWQCALPLGEIFDSSYERLVADPEPLVRSLHDFCGLPYNEKWSAFWKHARRVDTVSDWQIRRPIYRSSVQRWRNYAAYLGPLLELEGD